MWSKKGCFRNRIIWYLNAMLSVIVSGIRKIIARSALKLSPLILFPQMNVFFNRLLGYQLDETVRIYSSTQIRGAVDVKIGAHTFIGHETLITGGSASISIGADCDISDRVGIVCGTHEIDSEGARSAGKGTGKDIIIEDGVWIGYGAIILPGVRIGKKAIVAAGAVITSDVEAYTVAAGNPAREIRKLVTNSGNKMELIDL